MTPRPSPDAVLPPVRDRFRALATSIVPEAALLDDARWADLEAIVEAALAKRPPGVRRQLAVFIRLLDFLPRLRWLRPFHKLDADRRTRFLRAVQSSRIFLARRGFWGLRTLVCMGYYARAEAYGEIGYDAHLRGWLRHPDSDDAARDATLREATAPDDSEPYRRAGDPGPASPGPGDDTAGGGGPGPGGAGASS